jgi:hypothetical protein
MLQLTNATTNDDTMKEGFNEKFSSIKAGFDTMTCQNIDLPSRSRAGCGRTILGAQAKPLKWLYLGNRSEKDTCLYKAFCLE